MDTLSRENRILKGAVVLLLCAAAVQAVATPASTAGGAPEQQGAVQRLPGPGSGIVDVRVTDDVRAAQAGEWRVVQQGDWRVGVVGNVTTVPPRPGFLEPGREYEFQWAQRWVEVATVREVHQSGWVRVGSRWVNPANAIAIEPR